MNRIVKRNFTANQNLSLLLKQTAKGSGRGGAAKKEKK
jgi:hypothetical protein